MNVRLLHVDVLDILNKELPVFLDSAFSLLLFWGFFSLLHYC